MVRLAISDVIAWRNNANAADLALSINGSDELVFKGSRVISNAITQLTSDVTALGPGVVASTVAAIQGTTVSGVTGTGNVVFSSSPTLVTPALGTPASGVLTNCTGTASGLTAGHVTTNANLTGVITSVGNATSIASQTGTGTKFVVDTSPTLVTPTLGVATVTSVNKMAITAPATSSTLAVADGKTFTVSNTLTLTSTDGSTLAIGGGGTLGSNAYTSTTYAPLNSPTFTGTVTIPTPFTIGAVSMTSTGTQLNYLSAATGTTGTTSTNVVFSTSPTITSATLVTPALGTPASGVLTNCTGTASGLTAGNATAAVTATNLAGGAGGSIPYQSASGTTALLANGSAGQVLASQGTTLAPHWIAAGGTGTVTSVDCSVPTFLSIAGNPITTSGTLAITLSGTALPVLNGGTGVTTSTGSGNVVLSTSPTLVTPLLGTPTSGVLTNCTGTASGLTAGTVTTNANLTGDVTSSGNATTLTNAPVIAKVLTGYTSGAGTVAATDSILQAIQKLNGNDATNANLTGVITSVGNATSIASQTGTGTKFVVDTSPTLITPLLGTPTSGVLTNCTGTASGLTAGNVTTNANLTGDVTSSGNATTAAATQANIVTLSKSTGVAVHGTNTNDDAASGYVGQYIEATVASGSAVTLTNGGYKSICTLNGTLGSTVALPAGDWDITILAKYTGTPTGFTEAFVFLSTAADGTTGETDYNSATFPTTPSAASDVTLVVPSIRISTAGSTTYWLTMYGGGGSGTVKGYGRISARRVR